MEKEYWKINAMAKKDCVGGTSLNGLTKREYFAGLAMQGLTNNGLFGDSGMIKENAQMSVKLADALLEALSKP